jgi:hypothetical protein
VLPGRLGARFALEALFLVLLAVGAGLADLRPAFIILVMAVAWFLVALVELTAERIARSPVSYLLPAEPEVVEAEQEPEQVFGPPIEERTVVAPPQALEDTQEPIVQPEPAPEAEADADAESFELPPRRRLAMFLRRSTESAPEPEPEPEVPVAGEAGPEGEDELAEPEAESESRGRFRSLLRRRDEEIEPLPEPPPRHVKLLPRRSEPEHRPAEREVAELFDPGEEGVDAEETAG